MPKIVRQITVKRTPNGYDLTVDIGFSNHYRTVASEHAESKEEAADWVWEQFTCEPGDNVRAVYQED